MKKRYILPAILFLMSSCSDDFLHQEDPNAVSVESYFQTENDVLLAVNGLYHALRSGSTLGEGSLLYSEERSDNAGRDDNQSNAGEPFQFNDFSLLPSNTYLKNHWVTMYDGIARTNTILSNIDGVPFADESLRERYKAEARFLRALLYFHLVRKWGDIPLSITEFKNKEDVAEVAFREKEEVVYQQIVKDLTDALGSNLPNTQWEYQVGRTSKAAINSLLGQVYLTMAATLADDKQQNLQ